MLAIQRKQKADQCCLGTGLRENYKGAQRNFVDDEIFIILIVMMMSQVYRHVKID